MLLRLQIREPRDGPASVPLPGGSALQALAGRYPRRSALQPRERGSKAPPPHSLRGKPSVALREISAALPSRPLVVTGHR